MKFRLQLHSIGRLRLSQTPQHCFFYERIRAVDPDPHSFYLLVLDPDPDLGKN